MLGVLIEDCYLIKIYFDVFVVGVKDSFDKVVVDMVYNWCDGYVFLSDYFRDILLK